MKIAALVIAGNSIDVIDGCITHHRALGVDRFVVLHVYSEDSTLQRIRELEQAHSDISLVTCELAEVADGFIPPHVFARARALADADWIIWIDADERWMVRTSSLREILAGLDAASVTVPRFNAVWPNVECAVKAERLPVFSLDNLPLALHPVDIGWQRKDELDSVPWVLTRMGPKTGLSKASELEFSLGGHQLVARDSGEWVVSDSSRDLLIVQLPFSSLARFQRKLRALTRFNDALRAAGKTTPPEIAWHWKRWIEVQTRGPDAVEREWARQFMTPEQARELCRQDVIFNASIVFRALRS